MAPVFNAFRRQSGIWSSTSAKRTFFVLADEFRLFLSISIATRSDGLRFYTLAFLLPSAFLGFAGKRRLGRVQCKRRLSLGTAVFGRVYTGSYQRSVLFLMSLCGLIRPPVITFSKVKRMQQHKHTVYNALAHCRCIFCSLFPGPKQLHERRF